MRARYGQAWMVVLSAAIGWTVELAAQTAESVPMPLNGVTVQLTLGLKDAEPSDWDGEVKVSEGKVVGLEARLGQSDEAGGSAWKLRTRRPAAGKAKGKGKAQPGAPRPVDLRVTFDAPSTANVEVTTKQGNFTFALRDLAPGQALPMLDGRARVARVPLSVRVTSDPTEDDMPAAARAPDGTVWVAYAAYTHGTAVNADEAHDQGKFDSLLTKDNGDQVRLVKFDGRAWSAPMNVTDEKLDVWRPAVAADGKGVVWVIWSQNLSNNWDLYCRSYEPKAGKWSDVKQLTESPSADINPVAATDPVNGRVHVAWQAWREGNFDIWAKALDGADTQVSRTSANEWNPAMAFDSKGVLHVAYDTYERGNYDVKLASVADGRVRRTLDVAASARFEARASVAVDKQDRVWLAFEDSDPNWAKDYGSRWQGKSGIAFYIKRNVIVRCVSDGKSPTRQSFGDDALQAAAEVKSTPVETNYLIGLPTGEPLLRISFPRLGVDEKGRVWLLFRRHPVATGAAERWASYATYYDGDKWASETPLLNSDNLLDNRPALAALRGGGLLAVYSTDGRTGGTNTATGNDLRAAVLTADGDAKPPVLAAASAEGAPAEPVHPNEAKDIERVRAYRATANGKTYQLLRGEFHRHTELTAHRDQDGALEEMWRYALDVARMDWIGNGDHMNGGREYCWWLVQKQTNYLHHPPTFIPMYTYERSVVYPSGHRNVMFAQRGIRPLPIRQGMGTPEEGAPDIKRLFQYLKFFDGICSSHTSATGMGTDWRDNDPEREPVVEIYQGHRQNYEHYGAPGSAKDAKDSIGGYQPAGFVWNALQKGYRLGFQVSSDHVSTHLSYAIVFAEKPTREAILDGFKRRHSYGANDNIILDVRCAEHLMGDEFTLKGAPKFDITAIGTAPIAAVAIVRGVGKDAPTYVYNGAPNTKEVKFSWTDSDPKPGQVSYYYVRIQQADTALAWASPMWISVQ